MCEIKGQEKDRASMLLPEVPHMRKCRGQKRRCFTYPEQTLGHSDFYAEAAPFFPPAASPTSRHDGRNPVVPTTREAEVRRLLEPRCWRPAWTMQRDLVSKTSKPNNPKYVVRSFLLSGKRWKYCGRKKCINYINIFCKVLRVLRRAL